jgi:glycosyltransferase involved in cell wall biosynthesis
VATVLSVPLAPGAGLGSFVLGLFDQLRRRPDRELVLIAPEAEQGAAGRRGSQALMAVSQCAQLFRARPDVVHVHDHPASLAAAVGYRIIAGPSVRVVFSSHLDPAEARSRWKRRALGWLFARCAAVTVVSRNSVDKLDLFAEPLPPADVIRIVPGAASVRTRSRQDPDVVRYAASIGHADGPVLLQVSNFVYPAKVAGTIRLLEAFVTVRRRFPNARLIVLGRGPLAGYAQSERDRLGLADAVTIPAAFIEDLSLPAGLADIHCHITGQDACPISIIEAMHAGKPIVASRTGGIPEMIEHGVSGVLVDDDPARIAAAIIQLLERPDEARALGARARASAAARFTWERVAADVDALYNRTARPSAADYEQAVSLGH